MQGDLFTPDFTPTPYWWARTPRPAIEPPALPAACDVAVIGSGYTGLCAALTLARAGRSVTVLDAEDAGWGCSTRNGGHISTSVKPDLETLARRHGREAAVAILREGRAALAWVGDLVEREGIDCDFRVAGRFHGAHTPRRFERLAHEVEHQPAGLEVPARVVPRAEQHREIGTDRYFGGVVLERHASIDPARFHRGLLERCLAAGVTVIPRCPAERLHRAASGFEVGTPAGSVRARDVVVATNGYTGPLTPWLRRRVIPIGSYMIATEPLPPEVMDRLVPTDRVLSDTRRVVYYYRPSPDRSRILFGGRVSAGEIEPEQSARRLRAALAEIFPELAAVRVRHAWMGFVAYTFDTLAHAGVHEGVHYAMGYCGSGVSMAGYLGTRVAERLLGRPEGRTGFDAAPFRTRPLYRGRPWFLPAAVAWYRLLDRAGL